MCIGGLAACLGDETEAGRIDAIADPDALDAVTATSPDVVPDVAEEVAPDVVPDTGDDTSVGPDVASDVGTDVAPDVAPDVAEEVVVPECGDGLVEGDEQCDDGDPCADDGCSACALDPALALVELELASDVGWDLDDADGDGDDTTGIDNLLGSAAAVRVALSIYVSDPIAAGDILLVAVLGQVQSISSDDDASLALMAGAPVCTSPGPTWLDRDNGPVAVRRDPEAYEACTAKNLIDDTDDPANGIESGPPRLRFWSERMVLDLGPVLGAIPVARARIEGSLDRGGGELRGLDDGRIGGVVPAKALAQIDTSTFTPLCPTGLHAVLGLAGHIDQDAEDDGGKDFILWTTAAGVPCVTAPVTIVGCCDEGDCEGGRIDGATCFEDPRIGDGFSAGFRVRANAVNVVGPADACGP